jgi:2-amino-4-hydroxy-6-hydroxymethyldihydropteridine diphosphokinase
MERTTAYIGLGSNLGDRKKFIKAALDKLTGTRKVEVISVSRIVETMPLGDAGQPKYLNCVARIITTLRASALLRGLLRIETVLSRKRTGKWSPRTIDLDILLFGEQTIDGRELTIPHPQMHLRTFVLRGLCELNPGLEHPVLEEPVKELLNRLNGGDFRLNATRPQLVSIEGNIGTGKSTLAKGLSHIFGCPALFEAYDTNPFLPAVYAGNQELALDSQLYFLTTRLEQLNGEHLKAGRAAVSDYLFDKELIYAKRLLNNEQLTLYHSIYSRVAPCVTRPAMVIYLREPPEKCLKRIHKRNRPYEQKIELSFLETLDADYERLFAEWKYCPVIRLSEFDCLSRKNVQCLANQVKCYIAATDYRIARRAQKKRNTNGYGKDNKRG